MPFSTMCPACGVPLQLPDEAAGRAFACVGCGRGLATEDGGKLVVQSAVPLPSPTAYSPFVPTAGYAPSYGYAYRPLTREEALAKVRGPAILLIGYGFLWGILGLLLPLILLNEELRKEEFVQPAVAIGSAFSIALGAFTIFAGLRLMALRSFTLVIVCIGLNIALGVMVCWMMAIPVIWPLIATLDAKIKPYFRP